MWSKAEILGLFGAFLMPVSVPCGLLTNNSVVAFSVFGIAVTIEVIAIRLAFKEIADYKKQNIR